MLEMVYPQGSYFRMRKDPSIVKDARVVNKRRQRKSGDTSRLFICL